MSPTGPGVPHPPGLTRRASRPKFGDRGGAAGLSAFGLAGPTVIGGPSTARSQLDGDARFAMSGLAGALGGVYVASGVTLLGRLPAMAGALIAIGVLQALWSTAAYRGSRSALVVGLLTNILLALTWALSRMVGLSPGGGGGRLPVGVLDSLCAADSLVIVALTLGAWLRTRSSQAPAAEPESQPRRLRAGAASQLAILLAVLTVSALLGGHTHTAQAKGAGASSPGHLHFYCRLL